MNEPHETPEPEAGAPSEPHPDPTVAAGAVPPVPQVPQVPETPPTASAPPPPPAPPVPPAPPAAAPAAPAPGGVPPAPAAPAGQLPPAPPLPAREPRNPAVTAYLRTILAPAGLTSLAWIAGAVLAAGLLGAVLLLVLMSSANGGASPSLGEMIGNLLVALGVALGGGLGVSANVDTEFFAATGRASLTVFPLGVTALVVTGVTLVARWRMRVDRVLAPTLGAEAARAGIEAGAVAAVLTILTGFAKLGGSFGGGEVGVRTQAGYVFAVVLVTVAVTLFVVRVALRRRALGAVDGAWISALREAGSMLAVQAVAFGGVLLIVLIVVAVQNESAAPVLLGVLMLGNLAAAGTALGHLGSLNMGAGGMGSMSVDAMDIPDGHGAWLYVLAFLSIVAAAGLVGVSRQRTARPDWHRVWQMPLIVFGVWCVLALGVAGMTGSGEMMSLIDAGAAGSLGLTWTAPFLVGIGAAIASVGAEFLPLLVYRVNPALLRMFGGKRAAAWLAGVAPAAAGTAAAGAAVAFAAAPPAPAGAPQVAPESPGAPAAPGAPVPPGSSAVPPAPGVPGAAPGATPLSEVPAPAAAGSEAPDAVVPGAAAPFAVDPALASAPHEALAADAAPTEVLDPAGSLSGLLPPAAPVSGAAETAGDPGAAGAAAGAAAAGPALALPERAPMQEKTKRTLIVTISAIVGVGLLAVAGMITVSVMNQGRDPAGAVRTYLSLLEQGKADQASKLVDPGLQNADRELLTDAVLGAAEQRIEVVDVETLHRSDSGAEVLATLSLDGERFEHSFPVVSGPKEFLVLDTWSLREPFLVEATLSGEGLNALKLGETEVELEGTESSWNDYRSRSVFVYPGVYSVTGPSSDYITVTTEELRAVPGAYPGEIAADVTVAPSEAFEAEVLQQVQARITQCVEVPTNMDSVCPYLTQDKDLSELRVVSQPDGFEEINLTSFVASEGEIAVRSNPSSFNSEPDLRETTVIARGSIRFEDGVPTITDLMIW